MENIEWAMAGIQVTLVGILLATVFDGDVPYVTTGLVLGLAGSVVVAYELFGR